MGLDASRDMAEQSFDSGMFYYGSYSVHCFPRSEMLTPIDQPMNKLEDLHPDFEIYVYSPDMYTCSDARSSAKR